MADRYAGDRILADDIAALGSTLTAFTPTWTNLTVGSGTQDCAYRTRGAWVDARYLLTWGSTTSISGIVTATLPVAALASAVFIATAVYRDSSASTQYHGLVSPSGGALRLMTFASPRADISSSAPFTWATSDTMGWCITYPIA